jgi:hypothetical protein
MANRFKKSGKSRFVNIPHHILKSFAWSQLSPNAKAAYVEINVLFNGSNNGSLGVSNRWLGEKLNVSPATGWRALHELVTYGFVRVSKSSSFGLKRRAAEYRFTHMKCDTTGELPTNDYERITHAIMPKP